MKKAVIINDLSGLGKCSLTVAISVISVLGVQPIPLPTAVLSNQTEYSSYYSVDLTAHIDAYTAEWKKRNLHPDCIYTGYLASAEQADLFLRFIDDFSDDKTLLITDPVMGDGGVVYPSYTEALLNKMRDLAHRAQVLTPNLTEALLLLYGKSEMEKRFGNCLNSEDYIALGRNLLKEFHLKSAVITGIDLIEKNSAGEFTKLVGTLVCHNDGEQYKCHMETSQKIGGSYSGTGDLFASIICAGVLKGISITKCVQVAMKLIEKALKETLKENTDRNDGICYELFLGDLREDLV